MGDRKNQDDPYVTLKAAALALGESRNGVLGHIARRELDTEVVAGRPVVTRESLERLVKKREEGREKERAELTSRRVSRAGR